jgi:hypothetical protein
MAERIFINYRDADAPSYAALLYVELSRVFGAERVFLDTQSVPAGCDFAEHLLDNLVKCRVLIAIIGPRWLMRDEDGERRIDDHRDWIRRELAVALALRILVIPVLVDGADLPIEAELPEDIGALANRQYRRLRHRDIRADLNRLSADLSVLDSAVDLQVGSCPVCARDSHVASDSAGLSPKLH